MGAVCFRSCPSMFYSISFKPHAFSANGCKGSVSGVTRWELHMAIGQIFQDFPRECLENMKPKNKKPLVMHENPKMVKSGHLCCCLIGLTWVDHISWYQGWYNLWPAVHAPSNARLKARALQSPGGTAAPKSAWSSPCVSWGPNASRNSFEDHKPENLGPGT